MNHWPCSKLATKQSHKERKGEKTKHIKKLGSLWKRINKETDNGSNTKTNEEKVKEDY